MSVNFNDVALILAILAPIIFVITAIVTVSDLNKREAQEKQKREAAMKNRQKDVKDHLHLKEAV